MSGEQTDSTVLLMEDFFSKESYFARLEEDDRENLNELISLVGDLAEEKGFVLHLCAVGGTVDPSRINQTHKDIDVFCHCPELAIINNPRETNTKAFFDFFSEVAKRKSWKYDFEDAFFDCFEHAGDGKFIIKPLSGKPIEILPLRKDSENAISFEEFLTKKSGVSGIVMLS